MSKPFNLIKKIFTQDRSAVPPQGGVHFGSFRRLAPLSRKFGYDRGGPIDRYYIEQFLERWRKDVQGKVLEVKSNDYTRKFGNGRVTVSDILDINAENANANIIADITKADHILSDSYDCVILTQVIQFIYDIQAALRTVHRILKPGGILLLTAPGITQIDYQMSGDTWYWSFSETSVKRMLAEYFPHENITVGKHGNVLTAASFLFGLGVGELKEEECGYMDPDYQMIITARAVKGSGGE